MYFIIVLCKFDVNISIIIDCSCIDCTFYIMKYTPVNYFANYIVHRSPLMFHVKHFSVKYKGQVFMLALVCVVDLYYCCSKEVFSRVILGGFLEYLDFEVCPIGFFKVCKFVHYV